MVSEKAETQSAPVLADVDVKSEARRVLLASLRAQSVIDAGRWTRDELYRRGDR